MSLATLANTMASKGRHGDSMLVHMSPDEVKALQALAQRHGKTLTINPETGQPEAFNLKSLLPMIAGFALGPAGFGLMSSGMAAATVGGITALSTGDISRGLMAGLGAYGGASLGASLAGAGTEALASEATKAAAIPAEQAGDWMAQEAANRSVDAQLASKTAGDRLSAGLGSITESPTAAANFAKANWKPLAAAAAPIMADMMVPTTTKLAPGQQSVGYIRQKKFNPYTQEYVDLEPVKASEWGARKFSDYADGGIVALADGGMSVEQLYETYAGREADPGGLQYWSERFGSSIDPTEAAAFQSAISEARAAGTEPAMAQPAAAKTVESMYQNVLGRDVDPSGLAYWTSQLTQGGRGVGDVYNALLAGAQANNELVRTGISLEDAVRPYTGYTSAESRNIADEWVRNTLGREVTAADRQTDWYKQAQDAATMNNAAAAQNIYSRFQDYASQAGDKFKDLSLMQASQLLAPNRRPTPVYTGGNQSVPGGAAEGWTATTPASYAPPGTTNPYGNGVTPGDITRNADGTITVQPNIPGRPYGGFTGIQQLKDAYTAGGGSLGQDNLFVPKTVEDMYARYGNTGGSQQAYQYLMGKGAASIQKPATRTGELMLPYAQSVLGMPYPTARKSTQKYIFDPKTRSYVLNPDYVDPLVAAEEKKKADEAAAAKAGTTTDFSGAASGGVMRMALGGLGALAAGGQAGYNLGSYSDGGRLLRGPGDGVSDSIPATIGNKQPARLADGEFVVPARIVSELGNGSTDAGARKLYAMMDRVQRARGKTTGKGKVAKDTSADKYLPA